jgi:predicted permease
VIDVLNLALPYFGLIILGYLSGRLKSIPDAGLEWMNFFIVYLALPALFYRILSRTPLEELTQVSFIVSTTAAMFLSFMISFGIGMLLRRGNVAESAITGIAGSYGNVGYMGPGLALSTLGTQAAAPVALIFCFDTLLAFTVVPFLMALAGTEKASLGATMLGVLKSILLHPFIIATALGVLSAAVDFQPPVAFDRLMEFLQSASAPCALFALGLTVALRPIERVPWEVPLLAGVKLLLHPLIVLTLLSLFGPFSPVWVATAVLMAALPPALNVFVLARHYDTWVPQASGAILFGTAMSVLTLTTVMWLVKTGQLPLDLFP